MSDQKAKKDLKRPLRIGENNNVMINAVRGKNMSLKRRLKNIGKKHLSFAKLTFLLPIFNLSFLSAPKLTFCKRQHEL